MKSAGTYLQKLRFDEKLKSTFVAKYLANPRLLILVTLLIVIVGYVSYQGLPKVLNPEIKIPLVIVNTILPGAGPGDVESLVTVPIEDSVTGLENVKTVQSVSRDSVSIVTIEFESSVDPEKARTDVQSAVDTVDDLPDDALTPRIIKLDFENAPILTFALTSKSDRASLMRFAARLRDELKDLPTIEDVEINGLDEQEVQIVIKPETISSYSVNPLQLQQIIVGSLKSFPAGTVKTESSSFTLSIDPLVTTVDDIRNLRVSLSGTSVPLSEIAYVSLRSKPDQKDSFFATPQTVPVKALTFSVFKTKSSEIDVSTEDAEKVIDEELEKADHQYEVKTLISTNEEITDQYSELLRDFVIIIALVSIVLFIFLGARQALIASISVPLTFLITFIVMSIAGISINFISLFSLLLSLGLLVDDTIVVISAMTAYYRTGKFTPYETGLLVWKDFIVAIFTTTITTVWAFLPLLLSTGIIGEFIKPIPIVVSTTLLASFLVAMFVTLPFIIVLLKPNLPYRVKLLLKILFVVLLIAFLLFIIPKGTFLPFEIMAIIIFFVVTHTIRVQLAKKTIAYVKTRSVVKSERGITHYIEDGVIHFSVISNLYRRLIDKILISQSNRRKVLAMVVIFTVFSILLIPLGFVKNEFFPNADAESLYVQVELPAGTNLDITSKETVLLLDRLRSYEGVDFGIGNVGQGFGDTGGFQDAEVNNILVSLSLFPARQRKISSIDLAQKIRNDMTSYQKGKLSVIEQSGGPPAGADIQIKLFGDDLQVLNSYADRTQKYLEQSQGTANVSKSVSAGTSKIVFTPDVQKLSDSGVTPDVVGFWLRLFASGISPDTIKLEDTTSDKTDISIRLTDTSFTPQDISKLAIPTQNGLVTINQLGELNLEPNPSVITREDGKRTISVTASVQQGFNIPEKNSELEKFANTKLELPQGYFWKTGGVNEENQNSVNSILQAMILSFLLIIITMVVQFNSFRKALIVMLVIPLSISGVLIIFALTNTPLSFPALIGVLALFGIVVKNAILLVDKIIQNEKFGIPFRESIVDAAASRLEAIALTSFTAIIGLIPVTLSDPLWRGLGGAIIAGLTFSGTIMLFFIPVVYYYWFVGSEGKNKSSVPATKRARETSS